jgi:hypothetical protein
MSTGTRSLHQNERVVTEAIFPFALVVQQDDLTAADQVYVVSPVKGYVTQVYSAVNTLLAGVSTCTVKAPDGTVGTITIADASGVGTVDQLAAAAANNEVEAGEVIEIENDATPTGGAATFTIILSESA